MVCRQKEYDLSFRGRTLSSTRQFHARNTMIESGISQIIDLRADYSSDFYNELCQRSSISNSWARRIGSKQVLMPDIKTIDDKADIL